MFWMGVISRGMWREEGEGASLWWKCENSSSLNVVHDVAWEMWAAAGGVGGWGVHTQRETEKSKDANHQGKQMQKNGWGEVRLQWAKGGQPGGRRTLRRKMKNAVRVVSQGRMSAVRWGRRKREYEHWGSFKYSSLNVYFWGEIKEIEKLREIHTCIHT